MRLLTAVPDEHINIIFGMFFEKGVPSCYGTIGGKRINIIQIPAPKNLGQQKGILMKGELTAIIEKAPEGGYWAICPEISGANGQGETVEEAKESLREAISIILEDRLADIKRGLPDDVIQDTIAVA